MPNQERMFLALWADEVAGTIQQMQQRLDAANADVHWTMAEQLHVTVKFLGDTSLLHAAKVCRAMHRVAERHQGTELEIRGAGAFPKIERPRTLWAGIGTGADWLRDLHADVDLEMADLHYLPDSRFTPHVTIGRARSSRGAEELSPLLRAEADTALGRIGATEVALVSSRLEADGPVYEVIGRTPLGAT